MQKIETLVGISIILFSLLFHSSYVLKHAYIIFSYFTSILSNKISLSQKEQELTLRHWRRFSRALVPGGAAAPRRRANPP
jgi:hypothetical protein